MPTNIRARVDVADAVLITIGAAIAMFAAGHVNRVIFAVGAFLAFVAMVIALVIIPQRWFNDDNAS